MELHRPATLSRVVFTQGELLNRRGFGPAIKALITQRQMHGAPDNPKVSYEGLAGSSYKVLEGYTELYCTSNQANRSPCQQGPWTPVSVSV